MVCPCRIDLSTSQYVKLGHATRPSLSYMHVQLRLHYFKQSKTHLEHIKGTLRLLPSPVYVTATALTTLLTVSSTGVDPSRLL